MAIEPISKTRVAIRILLVLVIVLLLGLWVFSLQNKAVEVRIATVDRNGLTASSSTNGIVEPVQEFEAHAPVATVVTQVRIKAGDHVEKGKLLLALDDAAARAALAQAAAAIKGAQASLAQLRGGGTRGDQLTLSGRTAQDKVERDAAQRDLLTLQSLAAKGDASNAEVVSAQQRLAAAQAALQLDQTRTTSPYAQPDLAHAQAAVEDAQAAYAAAADTVSKSNVRAPFAGTVFSLQVHASQFVQAGDKMLELADLNHLQIRAYFDEPELGKLAVGQPATLKWAARPERIWHGHIVLMPSTIVHYGTRNVGEVLVSLDDNADGVLISATNVTVTVITTQRANTLTIPREALRVDGRGKYAYVIRNGHLQRADVTVGAVNISQAEVLTGLNEGESVVLDAVDGSPLKEGMAARAAEQQ
jgi:HlyD family secretion protein